MPSTAWVYACKVCIQTAHASQCQCTNQPTSRTPLMDVLLEELVYQAVSRLYALRSDVSPTANAHTPRYTACVSRAQKMHSLTAYSKVQQLGRRIHSSGGTCWTLSYAVRWGFEENALLSQFNIRPGTARVRLIACSSSTELHHIRTNITFTVA